MDFFDVVKKRRSIREYKAERVEPEILAKILDTTRSAPSARNRQPWKFIIITDTEIKQKVFKSSYNQTFILQAPVVIAIVAYPTDYVSENGNIAHLVDLAIAGDHLTLAATALGLGTCWIGAFDQDKMRDALVVPDDAHIVAIFTLGYPDVEPRATYRKPLSAIVTENTWNGEIPEWTK